MKKEDKKPSCSHCKKEGHVEAKCWKLLLELRPKRFKNKKGNKKIITTIQQDFGSDSGDGTKIATMGIQVTSSSVSSSTLLIF